MGRPRVAEGRVEDGVLLAVGHFSQRAGAVAVAPGHGAAAGAGRCQGDAGLIKRSGPEAGAGAGYFSAACGAVVDVVYENRLSKRRLRRIAHALRAADGPGDRPTSALARRWRIAGHKRRARNGAVGIAGGAVGAVVAVGGVGEQRQAGARCRGRKQGAGTVVPSAGPGNRVAGGLAPLGIAAGRAGIAGAAYLPHAGRACAAGDLAAVGDCAAVSGGSVVHRHGGVERQGAGGGRARASRGPAACGCCVVAGAGRWGRDRDRVEARAAGTRERGRA